MVFESVVNCHQALARSPVCDGCFPKRGLPSLVWILCKQQRSGELCHFLESVVPYGRNVVVPGWQVEFGDETIVWDVVGADVVSTHVSWRSHIDLSANAFKANVIQHPVRSSAHHREWGVPSAPPTAPHGRAKPYLGQLP
ncbi:hypothetical protein ORI20_31185 [Mycobacterium sp. CVI_P3]|uniref:Uncharacterized protein n=1 Tax=Mycobacterium pinniadriaticum TaxID=2994102 RepID=A0ABT3SQI4_9MYCO|nr:hypothetical protein [Mycobacterium pinniadriaticum]MCX2934733.1 hypothetical protein [Mycobacterium pinniadriaticum]MCX2941155.1 hypothetical protein [Mycobacterium pinniadriaticum]